MRAVLSDQELRVSGPSGLICEVWFRKTVPAKAPGQDLGVAYPQLDEGTLVAAVKFASTLKDYRKQEIKAGVYTLRYALSPVNGNHQGVAPQRDFLLGDSRRRGSRSGDPHGGADHRALAQIHHDEPSVRLVPDAW